MNSLLSHARRLRRSLFTANAKTIYLYAFAIGLMAGGAAVLFQAAVDFGSFHVLESFARLPRDRLGVSFFLPAGHDAPRWALVVLFPAIGGLLTGLFTTHVAPGSEGTGTDRYLDGFHNKAGVVPKRTALGKMLASVLTLSFGGSAGKEGPMNLIGAGIGSLFGRIVKMGSRAQRTLFVAGAASGLGAIFRSPLGGAIIATEILYREDFETDSLVPSIIASVTAYTIFASVYGFEHHFAFRTAAFHSPAELPFYALLGIFCTFGGYLFVRTFRFFSGIFARSDMPRILRPALGGLCVGLIGLLMPGVLGEGFAPVQLLIDGFDAGDWRITAAMLIGAAVLKMLATSLTLQSGGSGGTMMPSLFIGGMLGGALGTVLHRFFPVAAPEISSFVVVGMAACFASVTHASLGALVMVCELTGGYDLLPPLMTVSVISLILSHKWSLFDNQPANKFHSKAHVWELNPLRLQKTRIDEVFRANVDRPAIIPREITLEDLEKIAQRHHETDFILHGPRGELAGLVSLKDILSQDEDIAFSKGLVLAGDLVSRRELAVREEDKLYDVFEILLDSNFDKVPVIEERSGTKHLKGYLQYKDILRHYHQLEKNREGSAPIPL